MADIGFERLNEIEVLQAICRLRGKFGMMVRFEQHSMEAWHDLVGPDGRLRAAPYLTSEHLNGDCIHVLWLFFDTQQEMEEAYSLTVGPEGPTERNPHAGPSGVYALTCSDEGETWNENT